MLLMDSFFYCFFCTSYWKKRKKVYQHTTFLWVCVWWNACKCNEIHQYGTFTHIHIFRVCVCVQLLIARKNANSQTNRIEWKKEAQAENYTRINKWLLIIDNETWFLSRCWAMQTAVEAVATTTNKNCYTKQHINTNTSMNRPVVCELLPKQKISEIYWCWCCHYLGLDVICLFGKYTTFDW